MGLSKSVVIVNEYSCKTPTGGTRGGTPGDYVLRYMSRGGAVEGVTPVRYDNEAYVLRYMARQDATEQATFEDDDVVPVRKLKKSMKKITGQGGIAFGYGDFSLSDKKLKSAAKDIQKQFDEGHTVLKTVISFDEDYLREMGVVAPDFHLNNPGDYRGNIDQLKLRLAVMNGLDKMSKAYDDLRYIGVIQVDTKHVHVHLAMVDAGHGQLATDGTQRGKLYPEDKKRLRRGIDMFLGESQNVKMMCSNIEYDKRNTLCFVKRFTHRVMQERSFTQFMLSTLPENRNLWRYGTNDRRMRKPNALIESYVESMLAQPDSGYDKAVEDIKRYARHRAKREDLSKVEEEKLVRHGEEKVREICVNAVYEALKKVRQEDMIVETDFMRYMAMDKETTARARIMNAKNNTEDKFLDFTFRLRTYKTRLDDAKYKYQFMREYLQDYNEQEKAGNVRPEASVLKTFYETEMNYQHMLMDKYRHFLRFLPESGEYDRKVAEIIAEGVRIKNLDRMINDDRIRKMTADNAEEYGKNIYHETGGRNLSKDIDAPSILSSRLAHLQEVHAENVKNLSDELVLSGMILDEADTEMPLKAGMSHRFDSVKHMDLHKMSYDFAGPFEVPQDLASEYIHMAEVRQQAYMAASNYLEMTGQEDILLDFDVEDIDEMKAFADRLTDKGRVQIEPAIDADDEEEVEIVEEVVHEHHRTVRLDYEDYMQRQEDMERMVKYAISSLQTEELML